MHIHTRMCVLFFSARVFARKKIIRFTRVQCNNICKCHIIILINNTRVRMRCGRWFQCMLSRASRKIVPLREGGSWCTAATYTYLCVLNLHSVRMEYIRIGISDYCEIRPSRIVTECRIMRRNVIN